LNRFSFLWLIFFVTTQIFDNDSNNDNKYFEFTNTKNNNENNYDDKSNDPLNQYFGNNNDDAKDNDKKEVSEPTYPKPTLSDEIELAEKFIMWLMEIL